MPTSKSTHFNAGDLTSVPQRSSRALRRDSVKLEFHDPCVRAGRLHSSHAQAVVGQCTIRGVEGHDAVGDGESLVPPDLQHGLAAGTRNWHGGVKEQLNVRSILPHLNLVLPVVRPILS